MPRVAQCTICANANRSKPAADSRSMPPILRIGNLARGVCSGARIMRPGPYTRPQAGRNRPEWVVSINRNAWSGFGIHSRSEESAARDPWTGWRCAKSPNCPSSAAHLSSPCVTCRCAGEFMALKSAKNQVVPSEVVVGQVRRWSIKS